LISGGGPIDVGFGDQCLPPLTAVAMAGGFLYTLEDGDSGRQLAVRHLGTGELVDAIDAGDAWSLEVAPDGVVALGGETVTVGRFSEGLFDRWATVPGGGSVSLIDHLDLEGAHLGSATEELPCTPVDLPPLPDQGLPAAVQETRDAIFAAAAACDFEVLSNLVLSNDTNLWFGGREEPIRTWIRAARNGEDPLGWMVRILNTEPAFTESESGAYYAWPAVHITNSDSDWQALSGVLSAAELEQLYQFRESGYLGYRIGIGSDGRWWFALAGD
ncbi:MAG TPA: hypothetical protein VJR05_11870, partial [Acidimicrobiia bacterium]|nr:hypothetical protein [Acidimicrobiia bacterium]